MMVHPGIVLDFDHSTVDIAGVTFPACYVELPMCERLDEERHPACASCVEAGACLAGGGGHTWDHAWAYGCEFYVPIENGMIVNVAIDETPKGQVHNGFPSRSPQPLEQRNITLALMAPWAEREVADSSCWILCYPRHWRESWHWEDCEPEWAAEHIQRLAHTAEPFHPTYAMQPAKLVPISHPARRPRTNCRPGDH